MGVSNKPTIWKVGVSNTQNTLLGNVRFMQLWAGQTISFVGDAVSMVALVILVVQLTGSASAVGGALVAHLLPTLASPLFGVLADRFDRRVVLIVSDLVRATLVLGLVFVRDLVLIYGLIFLMGFARTSSTLRSGQPSQAWWGKETWPGRTRSSVAPSASQSRSDRPLEAYW